MIACEFQPHGIYLPEIDLWLDSLEPAPATWISHAHSDHAQPGHGKVWATPETIRIYQMRYPETEATHKTSVAYSESWEWNGARLTALPAGHILGAAQLLVEYRNERLVYSGDIKLRPPMLGVETTVVECDRLIIESTFGLPIFHFLDREVAIDRIREFAQVCLADGVTPVFFGYPLGRGQEIVWALTAAGIATSVHGAIARMIPEYERAGFRMGAWEPYTKAGSTPQAIVLVPGMRDIVQASSRNFRIAYVSGWASLDNARARSGAEELIPYSDHAGFAELFEIVRLSGASRVDVVHGYTDAFAKILRLRGVDAHAALASEARTEAENTQ